MYIERLDAMTHQSYFHDVYLFSQFNFTIIKLMRVTYNHSKYILRNNIYINLFLFIEIRYLIHTKQRTL